jgi:hypothetical protein
MLYRKVNNNYAYWGAVRGAVLEVTNIKFVFLSLGYLRSKACVAAITNTFNVRNL